MEGPQGKVFDLKACRESIYKMFDEDALPSLVEYIKIPNTSRDYDPEYDTNGLLEQAAQHIAEWVRKLNLKDCTVEIIKHEGYTPIIFTEIKGDLPYTVFYYGHFDKQPEFTGWNQGMGATIPVLEDGKLYGRGGADDGYSTYSTMLSIKALQLQGVKLPRCVMITEGDEESGDHIDHYIVALKEKIGNPGIFMCLDSGTCDYETFCLTTSLRGYVSCVLKVEVTKEGVHSGDASGVIPSTFRIARQLLSRIEDEKTGEIVEAFQSAIPPERYQDVYEYSQAKGNYMVSKFPFLEGVRPVSEDTLTLMINRGWKAQLEIVGAAGLPAAATAGNVLRPSTTLKLSMRLGPCKDSKKAEATLLSLLTKDPPYNAKITVSNLSNAKGWSAPPLQDFLNSAIVDASKEYFGTRHYNMPEGGSIPFMNILQELWPNGQFMITGVLGPESNAHGPNEFLHLEYTRKITCCMAYILKKVSEQVEKQHK